MARPGRPSPRCVMSPERPACTSRPSPVFSMTRPLRAGSPRTPMSESARSPSGRIPSQHHRSCPSHRADARRRDGRARRRESLPGGDHPRRRGCPLCPRLLPDTRQHGRRPDHAESQVSAMLGVQADGLLYGVARDDDQVLAWLVDEGIPVVLFNRGADSSAISAVLPDDRDRDPVGGGASALLGSSQHRARRRAGGRLIHRQSARGFRGDHSEEPV